MIFTIVCFGNDRVWDTLHLLNDLRNINAKVYLLTNQDLHLNYYQFENVVIHKTEREFNDFERYKIILKAFEETNEKYVYHLDCDSRFFNGYYEKFNLSKFENLLENKKFDIMCPWFLDPISTHLEKPDLNENKEIRNFKYGFDSLIDYFKTKCGESYEDIIQKSIPLETSLIFKRSDSMTELLKEMLRIEPIILHEEDKIGRKIKITGSGFVLGIVSNIYNLDIISTDITSHFFKGNFLKEVFPFNFKVDYTKNIYL